MDFANFNLKTLSLRNLLDRISSIDDNETETIELKDKQLKPADISDYITQFANNRGGLLIFGVNDNGTPSGKIKSFSKADENTIHEGDIATTPSVGIEVRGFRSKEHACWVIAVRIPKPSDGIKRISSKGALVKRVGSRRAPIFSPEYSYENQGLNSASIQDLDEFRLDLFISKLKAKAVSLPNDRTNVLELFQILRKAPDGSHHPTIAGMILFGKSPEVWVNGTRVNIIRYATHEKSINIIDSAVITGPILQTIEETENKVWSLIRKSNYLISGQRQEISEYPYMVIREAIHNAFFLKVIL